MFPKKIIENNNNFIADIGIPTAMERGFGHMSNMLSEYNLL